MNQPRHYRSWVTSHGLIGFQVVCGETDLMILSESNISRQAGISASKYHSSIREYIKCNPVFETSLEPLSIDVKAPPIVRSMLEAGQKAGVGPMAAVAGAIAEYTGKDLALLSREIIIENGGDIFLKTACRRTIAIYAGESPLSGKIGIIVQGGTGSTGVCTSSGTFGHSLSFGKADAAVVVSSSAVLADAAATAIGNVVKDADSINKGLDLARAIPGIEGALIIIGTKLGAWGNIEIARLEHGN